MSDELLPERCPGCGVHAGQIHKHPCAFYIDKLWELDCKRRALGGLPPLQLREVEDARLTREYKSFDAKKRERDLETLGDCERLLAVKDDHKCTVALYRDLTETQPMIKPLVDAGGALTLKEIQEFWTAPTAMDDMLIGFDVASATATSYSQASLLRVTK